MTTKKDQSEAVTDKKQTQSSDKNPEQIALILEVEECVVISDGKHEGIITELEHRTDPFSYIDIHIKEKVTGAKLRVGFPGKITIGTGLGKFLSRMDVLLAVGVKVDLSKELLGAEVTFLTQNEESDKGIFARVMPDSVKPKK